MADFRKLLFAFALVALLLGAGTASAQGVQGAPSAFTCVANAGTPVIVRVEGITELVGDLLMQCTGGNPTPNNQQVPVTNLQLTLNTNVTSRLLGGGYIDALLLIDDPYPTVTNPGANPAPVTIPANSPAQKVCFSNLTPIAGQCNYMVGTFTAGGPGTAYGSANSPYLFPPGSNGAAAAPSTIYVAHQSAANIVTWLGVPIDPPGTTGFRLVRMTNVRANACQLGLPSTLIPTQIVGYVQITGATFFTINNPQQTLAYIQQGLVVGGQNTSLQQCNNLNVGGGGIGGNFFNGTGIAVTSIRITEGFAQSFKRVAYTNVAAIC